MGLWHLGKARASYLAPAALPQSRQAGPGPRQAPGTGASPNSVTSGFGGPGWNAACRAEMNSLHKLPLINLLYARYGHIPMNIHTPTLEFLLRHPIWNSQNPCVLQNCVIKITRLIGK